METEILQLKELKRVPKLRFKEFNGNWIFKTLGKECDHISYGLTVRPKFEQNGIPLISAREITSGQVNISRAPKISVEEFNKLSDKAKPKRGDIFLSKTGTIGFTARFTEDFPIAITQNIAVIRLDDTDSNSPLYLMQYFKTAQFYRSAISRVNQSTIMDLQLGDIRKLQIPFSSFPEQQKIASFLSAVDKKIQHLTRKKELLETYKKGVMQQLFSLEIRFKDENGKDFPKWEKKHLGEVIKSLKSGKTKSDDTGSFDLYGSTGIIGKCKEISNEGKFILIARVGANAGQINFVEGSFGVTDNTLILDLNEILNQRFLFYFLLYFNLNKLIFGSGQPLITGGLLKKIITPIPHKEEQKKIADFLTAIDKKTVAVSQQITHIQSFKKGLLQQMFV